MLHFRKLLPCDSSFKTPHCVCGRLFIPIVSHKLVGVVGGANATCKQILFPLDKSSLPPYNLHNNYIVLMGVGCGGKHITSVRRRKLCKSQHKRGRSAVGVWRINGSSRSWLFSVSS